MQSQLSWLRAALPVLATSLVVGPILAQSDEQQQEKKEDLRIFNQRILVGATVTNGKTGDERVTLGTVSDLVFNGGDGEICHAILATDNSSEERVSVLKPIPWKSFTWSQPESQLSLDMTTEEIGELPIFDPANVPNLCADKAMLTAGMNGVAAVRSADDSAIRTARAEDAAAKAKTCTQSSKIAGYAVFAGEEELGSGGTVLLEPKTGTVAFLSLSTGGILGMGETTYLIPWAALKLSKIEDMDAYRMELTKGKDQLELAPKLGDEGADLNKKEFRLKLYSFYGVEPPAFDRETVDGGSSDR
jgi:hypothetical protein